MSKLESLKKRSNMIKTFDDNTYRPLPDSTTIKDSGVHGLGLHATKDIVAGTVLGETHVLVYSQQRHEWVRTPLGGFINHSEHPNCYISTDKGDRTLHTVIPIAEGDELTVYYRFKGYDGIVGDPDMQVQLEE
jgi:SET domain-containing protein